MVSHHYVFAFDFLKLTSLKRINHTSSKYVFAPVCIHKCWFKVDFSENKVLHTSRKYFSPVCFHYVDSNVIWMKRRSMYFIKMWVLSRICSYVFTNFTTVEMKIHTLHKNMTFFFSLQCENV